MVGGRRSNNIFWINWQHFQCFSVIFGSCLGVDLYAAQRWHLPTFLVDLSPPTPFHWAPTWWSISLVARLAHLCQQLLINPRSLPEGPFGMEKPGWLVYQSYLLRKAGDLARKFHVLTQPFQVEKGTQLEMIRLKCICHKISIYLTRLAVSSHNIQILRCICLNCPKCICLAWKSRPA